MKKSSFWGSFPLVFAMLGACGAPPGAGAGPAIVPPSESSTPATQPTPISAAPSASPSTPTPVVASPLTPAQIAVAASDRSAADRALDAGRKPVDVLEFFQIAPGQRVAELAAGGGYTAELLARVVGPGGRVFGQNSSLILQRFAEAPWSARLKKGVMKNVVRVDAEFGAPLPNEAHSLDAVLLVLFYHDMVWMGVDRAALHRAVYSSLRPGGIYGIVDHSAREGSGISAAKTFHRIEQSVVESEVTQAGFILDAEAEFLKNDSDTRDWDASPRAAGSRRGTSDRFVLRFKKPGGAASR